ncbi:hypothetical protein C6P45_003128 [Maudiozyma exigua]|uniref:Cyclin N-terminal domain-containing protein n=1 Tax=Maudiozyma exigua TaxID=34358 RepID=A0A9P7B236_MAUEX|nr:hypothetical protein C6P45_003128 [Kazachstania exigua]
MILPPPPGLLIHPHQFNNNNNNNQSNEKINGGVSETLDYDIDTMAEFVVKTAYMIFGIDTRLMQSNSMDDSNSSLAITSPNNYNLFLKGIISVLNATRLPSVTIFMSLDYLMKYLRLLPDGINSIGGKFINVIYQNTIVGLILANKFNDDKTFTNKSWSQATGMDLSLINTYERNWLNIFNWKLYDDKFILYGDFILSFQQFNQQKQETSIQDDLFNDLMKSPLGVPSPYFASSTGMNTPSTPFGLQTPKLSTLAHFYSSPYHYMNNNSNIGNTFQQQPVPNYNYQQPQPSYQSNFNIPIIKSSPITNIYNNNNNNYSYDEQFNYDYYNFYDSKQDPMMYPSQAQPQPQAVYPIYQQPQKNLQNDNLVWLSTNQQTYKQNNQQTNTNYSTIY